MELEGEKPAVSVQLTAFAKKTPGAAQVAVLSPRKSQPACGPETRPGLARSVGNTSGWTGKPPSRCTNQRLDPENSVPGRLKVPGRSERPHKATTAATRRRAISGSAKRAVLPRANDQLGEIADISIFFFPALAVQQASYKC